MAVLSADYVVVGGGLTGCVVASRLKQKDPSLSIIVLEAGREPKEEHDVVSPMGGFALQGSKLDWQYSTQPNVETQNRIHTLTAGKTLGGGSILNYGGWSRGDEADYNSWSRKMNDKQWGYEKLVPFFERSERFHYATSAPSIHSHRGQKGPMKITSVTASNPKRRYPLGEPVQAAWKELGMTKVANGCTGHNEGLSEWFENWDNGHRQPAYEAYPLEGVRVIADSPVSRLVFAKTQVESPKVIGVVTQNGETIEAHREVLLCAGALQSPNILMASGLGPASILKERNLLVIKDLPDVGGNMFDHFALFQVFKLRPSGRGLALGHPDLEDPAFFLGLPSDCVVNEGLPRDLLEKALDEDGVMGPERSALTQPGRCFLEFLVFYHPLNPEVPADGTHIATSVMLTLPSSRGNVILSSNPGDPPTINPGYFATALDRLTLIHGVRRMLQLMLATSALKPYIEAEVPPRGLPPLHFDSSDAEIEARIRASGAAHYHTGGTCALGSVVDAQLRVKGVRGARLCDASVLPSPTGGHPQASLYGVAEKAADTILLTA